MRKIKQEARTPVAKAAGGGGESGGGVNRLDEMDIEEVSVVPKAANRKTFAVVKADVESGADAKLEAVMEAVLKLEAATDGAVKQAAVKEIMELLEGYAGISINKSEGGDQAPTSALAAILDALTGVASTLKGLVEGAAKSAGAEAASAQAVQEALKSAGLDSLPAKVLDLASIVTKHAETVTGLAKRLARLEATPGEGHSVASDTPEASGEKTVTWGNDLAKTAKPKKTDKEGDLK